MCGIFAYIGCDADAAQLILHGLKALEYRGYDSWGIVVSVQTDASFAVEKKTGKIGGIEKTTLPKSTLGMGHTRWATHGGITKLNAHPHLSQSKTIAIVHNGVVENYLELRKELAAYGYTYITETDSEIIAHLIEYYRRTDSFASAVMKTMRRLEGSNAFVALDSVTDQLAASREGSPLVVGYKQDEYVIASDMNALPHDMRQAYHLADGETVIISKTESDLYKTSSGKRKQLLFEQIPAHENSTTKGKYPHFMLKEIIEQPAILATDTPQNEKIKEWSTLLKSCKKIVITGCGTAYHACLYATYLAAQKKNHAHSDPGT